ncbi:MAG: amino acid permease [Thermoplasmata archaeon]
MNEENEKSLLERCRERFFIRKDVSDVIAEIRSEESEGRALKRNLGALDVTAIGIGSIIGAGIFVLTGVATAYYAGPSVIISFILASLACAFAALCYAELAAMIPVSGSAYSYSYATMGELVAWLIGWDLVLEYAVGAVAVAVGWSGYLTGLLASAGLSFPVEITEGPFTGGIINLPAVLIVLLLTAILVAGIKESARINLAMVLVKTGVIVFVILIGLTRFNADNLTPFFPFGITGTLSGAALVFFAYIGFDAASTVAEETRNPQRDLPIGIIGSLVICTVLYIAVAIVLVGMVSYKKLGVSHPFDYAFAEAGFGWVAGIISAGAIAGITSVLLVTLLAQPRILFALSRDGLLPGVFRKIHPTFKTPAGSTIVTGTVVALAAGLTPIHTVAELTNIGTMFAFMLVCGAVLFLRKYDKDRIRPFRTPFVPVLPVLGIISCLVLMLSLPLLTWLRFIGWMGIGLLIYANYGYHRSVLAAKKKPECASNNQSRNTKTE